MMNQQNKDNVQKAEVETKTKTKEFLSDIFKPLGVVFGDIGTSPIYTLTVIALILKNLRKEDIYGAVSLIFWTLVILVSVQYAFLAMRFSLRGEGSEIVLREIILRKIKNPKITKLASLLTFIGISFLVGDGVITPAISILSAVEGLKIIPAFSNISQETIVLISIIIVVLLFSVQKMGVDRIFPLFSPIMLVWFLSLFSFGIWWVAKNLEVLEALSPFFAAKFIMKNKFLVFLILAEVILAATGGEALYSDMGHLGKKSIRRSWFFFVFPALMISYMGQANFYLTFPNFQNLLFDMVFQTASFLYIPFLILATVATIIASQAIILAMFSLFFQASNVGIFPRIKFEHKSERQYGQIYSGFVNYALLICVILVMIIFGKSEKLAYAYGLSVSITMLTTGTLLIILHFHEKIWHLLFLSLITSSTSFIFVLSTSQKLKYGAYVPVIIASIMLFLILIYIYGQSQVYKALKPISFKEFEEIFTRIYASFNKIVGTAVFLVRDAEQIPAYVINIIVKQGIIYERNVLLSLLKKEEPFGLNVKFVEEKLQGLDILVVEFGYMERINVEKILNEAGIKERIIFYGIEDIITKNPLLRIYSVVKKLSASFDKFYDLPSGKIHGVITRIEI
jgi:KUP system potassium uptake protein